MVYAFLPLAMQNFVIKYIAVAFLLWKKEFRAIWYPSYIGLPSFDLCSTFCLKKQSVHFTLHHQMQRSRIVSNYACTHGFFNLLSFPFLFPRNFVKHNLFHVSRNCNVVIHQFFNERFHTILLFITINMCMVGIGRTKMNMKL